MHPKALLREAWLNVRSGTTKAVLFAVLAALIGSALIVADATFMQQLSAAATAYQNAGASTYTVVSEKRVDAQACTALAGLPGVQAAGAIRNPQTDLAPAALPSSTIPYFETTVGFGALLGASKVDTGGLLVSDQVAETLQLSAGDEIPLRTSAKQTTEKAPAKAAQVADVYAYPDDGRVPGFGYAVLAEVVVRQADTAGTNATVANASAADATDTVRFDECWVRMWPESPSIRGQLAGVVAPGSKEDPPPTLSKLNNRFGEEFTGRAQFEDRVTRFAPVAAVVLGAVLGFAALRLRRIHLAAALHSGVRRRDLAIILGLEQVCWVSLSAVILVNVAAWCAFGVPVGDRGALFSYGLLTAASLILGSFVGAAVAFVSTRERALFRYFKER